MTDAAALPISIRTALAADATALSQLIELSVRALHTLDYSPEQIESALGSVLGLDRRLIDDQTYLIAEIDSPQSREQVPTLVGCGGWSKRKTLFGSDLHFERQDRFLDPATEPAKIRAFFIHPDWTRRGIATRLLAACEAEARRFGFNSFELGATIPGVRLFERRGYVATQRIEVPLPNGLTVPVVRMVKAQARAKG